MWFKSKPKNRRLDPRFVLEVKVRSDQIRAARWRLAVSSTVIAILGLSILLGVWSGGQWIMDRLIYSNAAFAIRTIDVRTDGVIAPAQLLQWVSARRGQNLLALDMAKVKRDLEMVPYVQWAGVERILPHTLKVKVIEREPVAQAFVTEVRGASGDVRQIIYQIDDSGLVMLPMDPRLRATEPSFSLEQLPILMGVTPATLTQGRVLEAPGVRAALAFIGEFNLSHMASRVDLQWIDVSAPGVLQIHTRQGSEVTIATTGFDVQLRRWTQIFDLYARSNKIVTYLDLSISNNIPLRWAEAGDVPPAMPRPPRVFRNRRHA
jgi:cell division septal protein FtsQ